MCIIFFVLLEPGIVTLKMIIQRTLNANREIITCFIEYRKAFDRVNHEKTTMILKKYNVDDKDLKVIQNLYWNQSTNIKIGKEYSKNKNSVKKGVR